MKAHLRRFLLAASASLAVCSLHAQLADVVIVERLASYHQSSTSAPTQSGLRFDVAVNSLNDSDLSGITPPTVSLPAGSTDTSSTTLVLNDGEWRYGPSGYGVNAPNVPALNTLVANGNTSVTVEGHTYTVDTDGAGNDQAFLVPIAPTLTMTGGTWSGGKYVIDVSQALTITTNIWTGFTTAGIGGLMQVGLGDEYATHFSRIAPSSMAGNMSSATSISITIAANTLTAGQDYFGDATFARFVSQDTSQAGVFAAAWWANETNFTVSAVSAIPEPSTYAALAGVAALGLVAWQRRRRQLAA